MKKIILVTATFLFVILLDSCSADQVENFPAKVKGDQVLSKDSEEIRNIESRGGDQGFPEEQKSRGGDQDFPEEQKSRGGDQGFPEEQKSRGGDQGFPEEQKSRGGDQGFPEEQK